MTTMTARTAAHPEADKLPLAALLALAMTGFLALLTETLPAGMLLRISAGMGISETLAGQFVTLYAIGSVAAAVPLTTATQGWRRRPLLLAALAAILIFNTLTALTDSYIAALAARFLAGMAGGLIWGMLAGYARRLVADPLKGRALAIAGVGAPIALSLGVPLGTLLGDALGWRSAFGAISLLTLAVMAWILAKVPDFAGQPAGKRQGVGLVLQPRPAPGAGRAGAVVLAHSILYTYVAPLLGPAGLSGQTDRVLLTFGVASLAGVWTSGMLIDRRLRALVLLSLVGFALAVLALGLAGTHAPAVYVAVAAWGVAFGGSPTLLQTASAEAAGPGADVAQSILATVWNVAIAGGGIVGGLLLDACGAGSLPWAALVLAIAALLLAGAARAHGFPAEPRHARRQ